MQSKFCSKCKKTYPLNNCFYYKNKTSSTGFGSQCKKCINEWHKTPKAIKRRKELAKGRYKKKIKDYQFKRLYGISLVEYNILKQNQNNICAICKVKKKLVVDHCHNSGKVRGLLCHKCNTGLGQFNDNKDLLKKAELYLTQTKISGKIVTTKETNMENSKHIQFVLENYGYEELVEQLIKMGQLTTNQLEEAAKVIYDEEIDLGGIEPSEEYLSNFKGVF